MVRENREKGSLESRNKLSDVIRKSTSRPGRAHISIGKKRTKIACFEWGIGH
jgi:hypothetical protein